MKNAIFWFGMYPTRNWGDHVQVLAIKCFISDFFPDYNVKMFYRSQMVYFQAIRDMVKPDDLIFIQGASDFGSLYSYERNRNYGECQHWHNMRKKIIKTFRDNVVVQLPINVLYEENERGQRILKEDKRFFNDSHYTGNLLLVARDSVSYETLKKHFNCDIELIPDLSFYYKPKLEPRKRQKALVVLRSDYEVVLHPSARQEVCAKVRKTVAEGIDKISNISKTNITKENVESGLKQLLNLYRSRRIVVTDRFHGLVFSTLTETPCVVLPMKIAHKAKNCLYSSTSIKFPSSINDIPNAIKEIIDQPFKTTNLSEYYVKLKNRILGKMRCKI